LRTILKRLGGLPELLESNFSEESKKRFNETLKESSGTNVTVQKLSKNPSRSFDSQPKKTIEEENELIGMLTKQLYLATNQIKKIQSMFLKAEERLKLKDQEIGTLKRKNKDLQTKIKIQISNRKKEEQQRQTQIVKSDYLFKRCRTLENRMFEMEKFLADYGLVWVGNQNSKSNLMESFSQDYIQSCYSQLKTNIEELNIAAGKDEVQVQHNQDGAGAMFKMPKCMNLKFYKNGLIVEGGRLRSYSDPLTQCFIRDILDGYFPSEFKNNYPNGVPLKVEDHRKETYVGDGADFPGHGYRLGKQSLFNFEPWTSFNNSANSWPGSARKSYVSTSRDRNLQSGLHDFSSSRGCSKTRSKVGSSSSFDLTNLRYKILASHNNNCSDTHLQSHINAELALSSRRSKVREVATKNTECHLSVIRDDSYTRRDKKSESSNNRMNNGCNNDRLSTSHSPSCFRIRSRSANFSDSEKHFESRQSTKIGTPPVMNNVSSPKCRQSPRDPVQIRTPRVMKSVSLNCDNGLPFLLQINEPSGRNGELRLKVRSLNGGTVYLIHISVNDTVSRLYHILDKMIIKTRPNWKKYHIVTNGYESKRLDRLQITLKEYGITRDSVLHLVNG
ncbi:uncharacterized protein LOC117178297, partial [Belonocnema kinseyi]|uniref:uncharacterized protein LOC117178297 n=1 Tax=Belonocnema kinseyi TaxID=2817044 RepID=UPI00143DF150